MAWHPASATNLHVSGSGCTWMNIYPEASFRHVNNGFLSEEYICKLDAGWTLITWHEKPNCACELLRHNFTSQFVVLNIWNPKRIIHVQYFRDINSKNSLKWNQQVRLQIFKWWLKKSKDHTWIPFHIQHCDLNVTKRAATLTWKIYKPTTFPRLNKHLRTPVRQTDLPSQ